MISLLKRRWLLLIGLVLVASLVGVLAAHTGDKPPTASVATGASGRQKDPTRTMPAPAFDSKQYSIDDPASLWVIVNKRRPLNPKTYAPSLAVPNVPLRTSAGSGEMHVSTQMAPALEKLVAASNAAGVPLMLASGYRSYDLQVGVYGAEVKNYGQAAADRESARPGYSEHQTGLAADLEPTSRTCEVTQCFGQMAEGKWLAENAYKYGFVIRYPDGKESTTGYIYEPWHVRYVGTSLAQEIHKQGNVPLETFFKLDAAPSYL